LVAGEWIGLPTDRTIYVLCWSGIRGKEVAEFLRSKGFVARFLESGSDGWVSEGGEWNGNIKFVQKYADPRYQIVFSTAQARQYEQDGVVFVDSRPAATYDKWHIPGSVNIPIIYTATVNTETVLAQVPPSSTVVTVCDDFVSCFDAKITGVKLEQRGHTFLGRYNKPWEYRGTN
jgi:rhodanese-related sulfurtransferase